MTSRRSFVQSHRAQLLATGDSPRRIARSYRFRLGSWRSTGCGFLSALDNRNLEEPAHHSMQV